MKKIIIQKIIDFDDIKISINSELTEVDKNSSDDLDSLMIELFKKSGDENIYMSNMRFVAYLNLLNITDLEKLAKDYINLQEVFVGEECKLEKEYNVNVFIGDNDVSETYEFTHDELMKISNGDIVEKYGIAFSKEMLALGEITHDDIKKININGIEAVSWTQEDAMGGISKIYMFLINGKIYIIDYPSEFNTKTQADEIINNIKLK